MASILPNKQCYAHAFVILAASSATLAGLPGAKELLDEALALYDLRFWNEEEGLSCDTWNTEFTVLDDYRGLNANMHTVEAFLAAADVTGEEKYRVRARTDHRSCKRLGRSQPVADSGALYQRNGSPNWTAIRTSRTTRLSRMEQRRGTASSGRG